MSQPVVDVSTSTGSSGGVGSSIPESGVVAGAGAGMATATATSTNVGKAQPVQSEPKKVHRLRASQSTRVQRSSSSRGPPVMHPPHSGSGSDKIQTAAGAGRRQTAPSDRDLLAVRELQRRIAAFRSRAAAPFGGSPNRQHSLPVPTIAATSASSQVKVSGKLNGSSRSTSSTSMEDRVRSLMEAAKRWAGARTNSVELAVAWASEDELDADDPGTFSEGAIAAAASNSPAMGQADAQLAPNIRGGEQKQGPPPLAVEHWGNILSSLAVQVCPVGDACAVTDEEGKSLSSVQGNSPSGSVAESPTPMQTSHIQHQQQQQRSPRATPTSPLAAPAPVRTDGTTTAGASMSTAAEEPLSRCSPTPALAAAARCSPRGAAGAGNSVATSSSSDDDSEDTTSVRVKRRRAQRGWDVLRKTVYAISPFLRIYRSRVGWVQIAGHSGSFLAGDKPGTILKRETSRERAAFERLQDDTLGDFVPAFYQSVDIDGSGRYLRMQDLLAHFNQPTVMDVKMGIRTYLEDELGKPGEAPNYRADLYKKMVAADENSATPEDRERKAITKARYMQFREQMSSSATLGFRIDGIKLQQGLPMRDFKHVREEEEVETRFLQYLQGSYQMWANCLAKLTQFRKACSSSDFLKRHEVIGSSLLFVGEPDTGNAGVWMIDFGKTTQLQEGLSVNHLDDWELGNREDGYLRGLDNLIRIWIGLHDPIYNAACCDAVTPPGLDMNSLSLDVGDIADDELDVPREGFPRQTCSSGGDSGQSSSGSMDINSPTEGTGPDNGIAAIVDPLLEGTPPSYKAVNTTSS